MCIHMHALLLRCTACLPCAQYHVFIALGSVPHMRKVFSGIRGWAAANRPEFLACPQLHDATPAI